MPHQEQGVREGGLWLRQPEFHAFLFFLMLALIGGPFLTIAASRGLAAMVGYLFSVWGVAIALLLCVDRSWPDFSDETDDV